MLLIALVLVLLSEASAVGSDCVPFAARTFFGRAYVIPHHPENLELRFNTNKACQSSFVKIQQGLFSTTIACSVQLLEVTNATTFQTYVHICSFQGLRFGEDIQYEIYGIDQDTNQHIRYKDREFSIQMVDPNVKITIKIRSTNSTDFWCLLIGDRQNISLTSRF